EDAETNVLPQVALVLPADDADGSLEQLAPQPQLAIERHAGQALDKPVGSVIDVALTREEAFTGPVGADAIQFFAHPPARQVGDAVPALREQEGRTVALFRRLLGAHRDVAADAFFLGSIAAQLAQVLAGPLLDRQRLIAPRRTGAAIDTAD